MCTDFKIWLKENTNYANKVICDTVSRFNRAEKILPVNTNNVELYLFTLSQTDEYKFLTSSVKSQMKKSIKLYFEYQKIINMKRAQ